MSKFCTVMDLPQLVTHCVKSVRIRSYSDLHFPKFGLNTGRYGVSRHMQSKCGKMQTRITPNTDTIHAVTMTNYNCHVKNLELFHQSTVQNMLVATKHLKSFLKQDENEIADIAVTTDGTWQKRYGHNSNLGMTFLISADTGEVLYYDVKSSYCKKCQYNRGDHDCGKNHEGSGTY